MAIPSAQLDTWSHQGGATISSSAYDRIKLALTNQASPLNGRGVSIFLQGSYANDTNTYGDSDIDVVVQYENTWHEDLTALTPFERQIHAAAFNPATYLWHHLRDDVYSALILRFGSSAVRHGTKAIKVTTGVGRMIADVLPVVQFRKYASYPSPTAASAYWGVHFFDASGNGITNYPKYHIEQGQAKNQAARTGGRYKATVRLFKNFRTYMVERGLLARDVAPSYFIECALHNVPDALFTSNYLESVPAILYFLLNVPFTTLMSQNRVTQLIGTGPTHWSNENFTAFVVAARHTWENW